MRHRTTILLLIIACFITPTVAGTADSETKERVFERGMSFFVGDVKFIAPDRIEFSIQANPSFSSPRGTVRIQFISEGDGVQSVRSSFPRIAMPADADPVTRTVADEDFGKPREGQRFVLAIVDGDVFRGDERVVSNEVDFTSKLK